MLRSMVISETTLLERAAGGLSGDGEKQIGVRHGVVSSDSRFHRHRNRSRVRSAELSVAMKCAVSRRAASPRQSPLLFGRRSMIICRMRASGRYPVKISAEIRPGSSACSKESRASCALCVAASWLPSPARRDIRRWTFDAGRRRSESGPSIPILV